VIYKAITFMLPLITLHLFLMMQIIGNETVVKVAKNKLAPPFKLANFDVIYGKGIDRMSEIVCACYYPFTKRMYSPS